MDSLKEEDLDLPEWVKLVMKYVEKDKKGFDRHEDF